MSKNNQKIVINCCILLLVVTLSGCYGFGTAELGYPTDGKPNLHRDNADSDINGYAVDTSSKGNVVLPDYSGNSLSVKELLDASETSVVPPVSQSDIDQIMGNISVYKELGNLEKVNSDNNEAFQPLGNVGKKGKLNFTISSAISMALGNNRNIAVESLQPAITETQEEVEAATFDPVLTVNVEQQYNNNDQTDTTSNILTKIDDLDENISHLELGLQQYLPTGTTLNFGYEMIYDHKSEKVSESGLSALQKTDTPTHELQLKVTQRLLRGYGLDANLARLRQAQIQTNISLWQYYGIVESFVSQVELAAWDYIGAVESQRITESSLAFAELDYTDTIKMIEHGKLAQSDKYAPLSRVAQQREQLVAAIGAVAENRITLLQLLSPNQPDYWARDVELSFDLLPGNDNVDICPEHIELALQSRPDILQANLQIRKNKLEVVYTKNGLLPELDFFVSTGWSKYSQTFSPSGYEKNKDSSASFSAGLTLQYNFGSRQEQAVYTSALLTHEQAQLALVNQKTLVIKDVTSAYAALRTALGNIKNSSLTRLAMTNTYEAEKQQLRGGDSSPYQVGQALDDMQESRLRELGAVIAFRKALVQLFLSDSSILPRRGIKINS